MAFAVTLVDLSEDTSDPRPPLAALPLAINPAVALLLVKLGVRPIAPKDQPGAGYERDLALIAASLAVHVSGDRVSALADGLRARPEGRSVLTG